MGYHARLLSIPPIVMASLVFFLGLAFFVSLVMALGSIVKDR